MGRVVMGVQAWVGRGWWGPGGGGGPGVGG